MAKHVTDFFSAPQPEATPWPPWESTGLRETAYQALADLPLTYRIGTHPRTDEPFTVADLKAQLDARSSPPGFVLWYLSEKQMLRPGSGEWL